MLSNELTSALPVVHWGEPANLQRWARMVASPAGGSALGFVISDEQAHVDDVAAVVDDDEKALERVLRFQTVASTTAFELAKRLSSSSRMTLPVMRLIQQTLPGRGTTHLAEIDGGLLTRIDSDDLWDDSSSEYEFHQRRRSAAQHEYRRGCSGGAWSGSMLRVTLLPSMRS